VLPPENNLIYLLKANVLFSLADQDQLEQIASSARSANIRGGQVIYDIGDTSNGFFLILSGRVVIERETRQGVETLSELEAGDTFGTEMLANSTRKRLLRATAAENTTLLKITRPNLKDLADQSPEFKEAIHLEHQSFVVTTRKPFPWKNEGENILYITRKHKYILFTSLIWPVVAGVLMLIPLGLVYFYLLPGRAIVPILIAAELGISICWALWKGWDWTNDYYVITNQRLLNLEKVVLFYESRQETPLEAILSLDSQTSMTGRWVGFGTLQARTYTGAIRLDHLESPEFVIALLQDAWTKAKQSQIKVDQTQMEADIQKRVSGEKTGPGILPVNTGETDIESGPLVSSLADLFKLKEIQGDTVIYRTHWWILVRRLFLPMVLLILWVMTLAAAALGYLGGVEITLFFSVILLSGLFLWVWFLYRIVDWRNDYYMITPDQLIDVHRKPLGSENKKSAPLKNIQTIEYKRLGMIGILLNFGTVYIRIGETEFPFDHVSDPSSVQKELFSRFMALTQREKKNEAQAQSERIADYIDTYHRMTGNLKESSEFPSPKPDSE
jgi:hypothetical protein